MVVHAEHFNANNVDDQYILWNNYYDYQFTNADKVDFFIVATDRQKEVLAAQFAKYTLMLLLFTPSGRKSRQSTAKRLSETFSLMTASRLATENTSTG